MSAVLLFALFLSQPVQSKLVKSFQSKANQKVTRENLRSARTCDGKERKCADGSQAGIVLPSCELVCPEDKRMDLSCYQGLADDEGEYEYSWVVREVPGQPEVLHAGASWSGSEAEALDCTVFELVKQQPSIPAASFRRPASRSPGKVRDAR